MATGDGSCRFCLSVEMRREEKRIPPVTAKVVWPKRRSFHWRPQPQLRHPRAANLFGLLSFYSTILAFGRCGFSPNARAKFRAHITTLSPNKLMRHAFCMFRRLRSVSRTFYHSLIYLSISNPLRRVCLAQTKPDETFFCPFVWDYFHCVCLFFLLLTGKNNSSVVIICLAADVYHGVEC